MNMLVHVLEAIHPQPLARLKALAEVVDWNQPGVGDLSQADAVIVRAAKIDRKMLENSPRLKVIGKHGVGLDAIDLQAAQELGRKVVFTPNANLESVAELAVALMLSAARLIPLGHGQLKLGAYETISPQELTGTELTGKTVGLVGMGRIGQRVAAILRGGFQMKALGYDPLCHIDRFKEAEVEKINRLEDLLPQADYINISVPLSQQTMGLFNHTRLAWCKPGAILVNTARGGIVDEEALAEVLKKGPLRAAASDVFLNEPLSTQSSLLALPNFIAMPHVGASTEESLIRMGDTVVADVLRVLSGQEPLFPVPLPA
ncbi:MAG: hydroxyacid dehydrogenase [Deltaproteobacteria bacterium]|jgi:phosphoglycerate dehydrogenase-like enzyme|nr:hydroxyacid dehydrogenase [Deltaproteobacteria bacterium]